MKPEYRSFIDIYLSRPYPVVTFSSLDFAFASLIMLGARDAMFRKLNHYFILQIVFMFVETLKLGSH